MTPRGKPQLHQLDARRSPETPKLSANYQVILRFWEANRDYRSYAGPGDIFFSSSDRLDASKWRAVASAHRMHSFAFDVHELRSGPHVKILAASLQQGLNEAAAITYQRSKCSD